ncbi:PAP2 superfamily protein [Jatrophihabitans endophyticus]|uniref:PAP2 superfamily protein n=1 Tax=Jatrophihabitans endophyticus TaxID=1206085 RepID=A0A1M5M4L6_9ACTN|nr:phosphatase PAP2 family protein [Jatrophihabitans endophyticus]SHG71633.1 PAP2 superfamily protein [Jatrophihabitans endophyticus]
MQTLALDWQQAAVLTGGLAAVSAGLTVGRRRGAGIGRIAPFAREATLIGALYTLWQLAGTLSLLGTSGAFARANWIERTERAWHLPAEASVQRVVTGNDVVAQAANLYYATMHFSVLFVFLLWLFVRHREHYRPVRRVLALTTFVCLAIQLLPVAPPRLLPGYVDTAAQYGQSVYGLGFGADQLSAMPSVHVAWAALVGWSVWRLGRGRWRALGPVHTVVTVVVVVATANHFWADGIVAVAVLAGCAALERGGVAALERWHRARRAEPTPALPGNAATTTRAC